MTGFSLSKQSENLDPSYETDLDIWDCFEEEKPILSHNFIQLCVILESGKPCFIAEQEHPLRVPMLGCSCNLETSKLKKGHNFVKKVGGLPPLSVWVPLLIVNNYSEFQVNIFSNNRDISKYLQ